jgi:flagellar motor switch/type III secretory pathway protein FliN
MATVHPLPAPAHGQPRRVEENGSDQDGPGLDGTDQAGTDQAGSDQDGSDQALLTLPQEIEESDHLVLSAALARMPVELDVGVPVRNFRVRNLLTLEPGQVIATQWLLGEDMPLAAGDVKLAWSEFEVVDSQLAVRVTRLA